jgi:hypothetical protein
MSGALRGSPIDWPELFGLVMIVYGLRRAGDCVNQGSVPEVLEHGLAGFIVQDMDAVAASQPAAWRRTTSRCTSGRLLRKTPLRLLEEEHVEIPVRSADSKMSARSGGIDTGQCYVPGCVHRVSSAR